MSVDNSKNKIPGFNSLQLEKNRKNSASINSLQILPGDLVSLYVMNGIRSNLKTSHNNSNVIGDDKLPTVPRKNSFKRILSTNRTTGKRIDIGPEKVDS